MIKNSERTPSERRENAKKAGEASGKARRKKANLKKAFETILQADVANPNVKKQLEDLGFDSTNEMALAMVMMQKAMKGNVRAFEQISKLTTTDVKDSLDKKEQKERIKALELENEKRKITLEGGAKSEDVMSDYFNKLEDTLGNDS
ncbi:phage protein [Streptococcus pneumoniae]|nr:phage protein [Streptococcus pneumoniae]